MASFQEATAHCDYCNHEVTVRRPRCRHFVHFILSVGTAGVWIPIWMIESIRLNSWRCERCEGKLSKPVEKDSIRPTHRQFVQHFQAYTKLGPWAFCWRITAEAFLVSVVVAIPLHLIDGKERYLGTATQLFASAVLVAPVLETLLCQALPIMIARFLRATFTLQVLVAWVAFALPHFREGLHVGIAAGVVGGFYFGFTYAHWIKTSRWTAFWTTATSHALQNGALWLIITALGG